MYVEVDSFKLAAKHVHDVPWPLTLGGVQGEDAVADSQLIHALVTAILELHSAGALMGVICVAPGARLLRQDGLVKTALSAALNSTCTDASDEKQLGGEGGGGLPHVQAYDKACHQAEYAAQDVQSAAAISL